MLQIRHKFLFMLTVAGFFMAYMAVYSQVIGGERVCVVKKYHSGATYPCREISRDNRFKYLACDCKRLRR